MDLQGLIYAWVFNSTGAYQLPAPEAMNGAAGKAFRSTRLKPSKSLGSDSTVLSGCIANSGEPRCFEVAEVWWLLGVRWGTEPVRLVSLGLGLPIRLREPPLLQPEPLILSH